MWHYKCYFNWGNKNVIYILMCETCEWFYLGQTTNLKHRIRKHKSDVFHPQISFCKKCSEHLRNCSRMEEPFLEYTHFHTKLFVTHCWFFLPIFWIYIYIYIYIMKSYIVHQQPYRLWKTILFLIFSQNWFSLQMLSKDHIKLSKNIIARSDFLYIRAMCYSRQLTL